MEIEGHLNKMIREGDTRSFEHTSEGSTGQGMLFKRTSAKHRGRSVHVVLRNWRALDGEMTSWR